MRANGQDLLTATVTFPQRGAWVAEVEVDPDGTVEMTTPSGAQLVVRDPASSAALSGQVTLEIDGATLVGTVQEDRSGVYAGRGGTHIVGGAGGLKSIATAQTWKATTLRAPLTRLLNDAGEMLSEDSDDDVLDWPLNWWLTCQLQTDQVLDDLMAAAGGAWRVLDDGTIWVGRETWPEYKEGVQALPWQDEQTAKGYQLIDQQPGAQMIEVAPEVADIRPGVVLESGRVTRVVYEYSAAKGRCRAYLGEQRGLDDTVRRLVREVVGAELLRLGLYPGRVVSQDTDGSVQVVPDRGKVPGANLVPLKTGIPGLEVKVKAGARVLLGFEEGDPQRPYAALFERDLSKLDELHFTVDTLMTVNGGDKGVARVDDDVDAGTLELAPGTGGAALTWTPPGGGTPVISPPDTIPLAALITSGAPKFKA